MLFYYEFYRDKGLLPQPGSVMDQSNKALSIFRILNDVNAECDKAQSDRTRANREQTTPAPRGQRR